MNNDAASILEFWFGGDLEPEAVFEQHGEKWWKKSPEFDAEIRQRFGKLHADARAGKLDGWCESPTGRVALILLLDQFSRNLYRGDPDAFASDARALAIALEGIAAGEDQELSPPQRAFLYMPLMHAEDAATQAKCHELFSRFAQEAPAGIQSRISDYAKYAEAHKRIVDRFGRFPHRNQVLSRSSTEEELEFLKQPGSSF